MAGENKGKSSVEEIRARFDADVERFSDENTGQTTTMDAALVLDQMERAIALIHGSAQSPASTLPSGPVRMLDVGCGAGNFSIRVLRRIAGVHFTLVDLSRPMLDRAQARIVQAGGVVESAMQADIRDTRLGAGVFDIVCAASVLHHLRSREEWRAVLAKIHASMKPGGTFWYWDLVAHENPELQRIETERYGEYIEGLGGPEMRKKVFAYIEEEDSPETPNFIMRTLADSGFSRVDLVHKNACFAAIMAQN